MSTPEVAAFLEGGHTLMVASVGRDGFPHLVPMFYVVDGDRIAFRSFTKSQKIVNLKRDPRITVLVEEGRSYAELRGVLVKGHAHLIDDPDFVLTLYGKLAAKYPLLTDPPAPLDRQALRQAFGRFAAKNTAVIVEPLEVVSWDHSRLGGRY